MFQPCFASSRRVVSDKARNCSRCITTLSNKGIREQLRELLRETAQSVAVVTTALRANATAGTRASGFATIHYPNMYHGATLSSFTSIALDPYPLVAFSLRIPSRMATALNSHVDQARAEMPGLISAHMVINILSAPQADLAVKFSRADLHPRPFEDPDVHWTKSEDGLPILSGALGALSCASISRSLPLGDLSWLPGHFPLSPDEDGKVERQVVGYSGSTSELFIARVLRVEGTAQVTGDSSKDINSLRTLPLLYHRRKYVTTRDVLIKS